MHVRDIMEQPAVTCSTNSNSNHAAQLMWEHDFGSLPVVDHDGRLAGIVTDRDICMGAYTQGATLSEIPVSSVMTQHALACHPGDTVETAEELMREAQIRRLAQIRYEGGATSYLEVLDADTRLFSAELGLAEAQLAELDSVVELYRALGGGWN